MNLERIDPEELARPSGFAHAVKARGTATVHLAGQTALDRDGRIVGTGVVEQFEQALGNLLTALRAAGRSMSTVHTGPNTQFGGLKDGFLRRAYQSPGRAQKPMARPPPRVRTRKPIIQSTSRTSRPPRSLGERARTTPAPLSTVPSAMR